MVATGSTAPQATEWSASCVGCAHAFLPAPYALLSTCMLPMHHIGPTFGKHHLPHRVQEGATLRASAAPRTALPLWTPAMPVRHRSDAQLLASTACTAQNLHGPSTSRAHLEETRASRESQPGIGHSSRVSRGGQLHSRESRGHRRRGKPSIGHACMAARSRAGAAEAFLRPLPAHSAQRIAQRRSVC